MGKCFGQIIRRVIYEKYMFVLSTYFQRGKNSTKNNHNNTGLFIRIYRPIFYSEGFLGTFHTITIFFLVLSIETSKRDLDFLQKWYKAKHLWKFSSFNSTITLLMISLKWNSRYEYRINDSFHKKPYTYIHLCLSRRLDNSHLNFPTARE